ncbi:relaxase/mobilization nuclease domain-containing protein [Hymenobacter fodinae]|uniref:MobA/VirD2-like nuclease domain-containing protein n=1 Tax=Hymenobacter fodinae TaxID=2510796 RepID=A0A4Z0P0E7_9BACT|nr:hypothetical protein [Hymenobacter fodinae]TGE04615.1 hypothetical protein EU556_20740 [Hymenobacter fodinae]
MLLKGNTRGAGSWAEYLFKNTNDRAQVLDIRGTSFPDSLAQSILEMSLTGAQAGSTKPFMSVSINPSPGEDRTMTYEQWLRSADIAEKWLGLEGQRRFVVLHEKKGKDGEPRTHIHVGWERYSREDGKLISDSHMRHRLVQAKIQMELEFGHKRTKDYDRQHYAIAKRIEAELEAQGRMAKREVADRFAENSPDISKRETTRQERVDRVARLFSDNVPDPADKESNLRRILEDQEKRDRERDQGQEPD